MYGALDVSTSALVAHRTRLEIISANVANSDSLANANGEYDPYRRRFAILAPGDPKTGSAQGVHVKSIELDQSPLEMRYEPNHKFANEEGKVGYPNVSTIIENMNAVEASRAYDANIAAVEATKSMSSVALQMIA